MKGEQFRAVEAAVQNYEEIIAPQVHPQWHKNYLALTSGYSVTRVTGRSHVWLQEAGDIAAACKERLIWNLDFPLMPEYERYPILVGLKQAMDRGVLTAIYFRAHEAFNAGFESLHFNKKGRVPSKKLYLCENSCKGFQQIHACKKQSLPVNFILADNWFAFERPAKAESGERYLYMLKDADTAFALRLLQSSWLEMPDEAKNVFLARELYREDFKK